MTVGNGDPNLEQALTEQALAEQAPAEHAPAERGLAEHAQPEHAQPERAPAERAPAEQAPAEHAQPEHAPAERAPAEQTIAEQALAGTAQPPSDREARAPAPAGAGVLAAIEACIPALRRYAVALLRSRDEADDLVHDCLARALDKLHTRREEADIRAWLFTIMHNHFISQVRRRRSRPAPEPLDDSHEKAAGQRATQEDALLWRDLQRGLALLPEEQRSVILLVSVEDLSYTEAAQVLGVPIGTVMSRLARGRDRLREHIGQAAPALRRVK